MAWSDWANAIEIPDTAGIRYNAATGRNYLAQYGEYAMGGPMVAPGDPTWYMSYEPHANRSNEGAFVRHDSVGNVVNIGNFAPREKHLRNGLLAAAGVAAFGFGGAALMGAGGAGGGVGGVTGAASGGGSGAFLGEGVVSGVGSWDAALTAASQGATSTASTIGSTFKSALSGAQNYLKPALGLVSTLTGGATAGEGDYVPIDQSASAGINPLVWVALAVGVGYLLLEK